MYVYNSLVSRVVLVENVIVQYHMLYLQQLIRASTSTTLLHTTSTAGDWCLEVLPPMARTSN